MRVIIQLRNEPLAVYLRRMFPAPRPLTTSQAEAVQNYANQLAAGRRQFLEKVRKQGIEIEISREFGYLLNGFALSIQMHDWHRLEKLPQVQAVSPDYEVQAALSDSVPLIGAPSVWTLTDGSGNPVTGHGVRVAIMDTGVDYTHPDLGGCLGASCKVIGGYDFVNNDADPMDDHGHGTHVAGIVAASGVVTGVAPGTRLLAYKVLNAYGSGWSSAIIDALELAADPDGNPATDDAAHVVNMSLGGPGNPDDPLSQAVDNAVGAGLVVAVAAGNSGPWYESLGSPGVARKALTVAASDKGDQLAWFSSRGPIHGFYDVLKPDITAPGVSISATVPISGELGSPDRYLFLSGTSMATPHVAGAAALIKQLHPDWTPEMIKSNLMNTAKDLGTGLYDQGAGRVRLAEAALAPLVAVPGSLGFGLPFLGGTTSARLTLINVSTATLTATASISTALRYDGGLTPLTTTVPVTYAQLSGNDFTISAGMTNAITVSLNIPNNAPEGYYAGMISLRGANYTLTVPFGFALLSKVTVHLLDEEGVEWLKPWDNFVVLVGVPEVDVIRSNGWDGQLPATFYVPSGAYNVHGYARWWINNFILGWSATQQKPLVLAATTTINRNATQHIYVSATTARRFTLDATTFAGDPLFVGQWRAGLRYQNAGKQYVTGLGIDSGAKDTDVLAPLPASFDFYISDTPDHLSFAFASMGYGYSPRYRHFRDLNSPRWYEGPNDQAGFNLAQNADEVHWFAWQYPRIDASTPVTFSYSRDQVSHYRVKYDFPGTMNNPWLGSGYSFASGGEVLFYLPTDFGGGIYPLSAGLERDIYVNGAFAYRYFADDIWNNQTTEMEFYRRDWTKAYTLTWDTNLQMVEGWDLQPLPPEDKTIRIGAGPLYPAVTFDNSPSTIRLIHPVFGSSQGNKVAWGSSPYLVVYRNGILAYSASLYEFWYSPSPLRQIPLYEAGNYRLRITSDHDGPISYNNLIEARFTLPAADMNPPRVTSLEMPQRFAPGQTITVTITVTDTESGVNSMQMRYSIDEGNHWSSLPLIQQGARYTAALNPGNALTVSLAYTATDNAGNYLAFTTLGAAIRETPITLTLEITPTVIPLTSTPFTLHFSGTLRNENGEALSQAALPIAIYLNDQFAGYVRDVARLEYGTFQTGTIGFDWSFIPTDFVSSIELAQLKFVYDMGTYARQERIFTVAVVKAKHVYLPVILRNH